MKLKKFLGITIILSLVTVIFLSSGGLVSALNSSDASVDVVLSPMSVYRNGTTYARVTFNSNFDQSLQIQRVGLHFDWMANNSVVGFDTSSSPLSIAAQGKNLLFSAITVLVPTDVTTGDHKYYVTIDGQQGPVGSPFTWTSQDFTVHVYASAEDQLNAALGITATPTPTVTPSSGGGETGSSQNWLLIVAVVAVVAIVAAVLILVIEMRKKPKAPTPAESPKPAAEAPKPAADEPVKNIEE
jgi:hypothetical protein